MHKRMWIVAGITAVGMLGCSTPNMRVDGELSSAKKMTIENDVNAFSADVMTYGDYRAEYKDKTSSVGVGNMGVSKRTVEATIFEGDTQIGRGNCEQKGGSAGGMSAKENFSCTLTVGSQPYKFTVTPTKGDTGKLLAAVQERSADIDLKLFQGQWEGDRATRAGAAPGYILTSNDKEVGAIQTKYDRKLWMLSGLDEPTTHLIAVATPFIAAFDTQIDR